MKLDALLTEAKKRKNKKVPKSSYQNSYGMGKNSLIGWTFRPIGASFYGIDHAGSDSSDGGAGDGGGGE